MMKDMSKRKKVTLDEKMSLRWSRKELKAAQSVLADRESLGDLIRSAVAAEVARRKSTPKIK